MKNFTLRFMDEKLHEDFKIKCVKEKTSMQQELIKMVEQYVKEGEKEDKK